MITVFDNILTTKNPNYTTIEKVYEAIKCGKLRAKIEQIRLIPDKKQRDKLKNSLPSICFSGKFPQRNNELCLEHSGYVCLDFDHLENYDEYWNKLKSDEYTCMMFRSPSGDGIKLIVKIPPSIPEHPYYCEALFKYYNSPNLDKFKDIARVCFASYDTEIYFNKDSKVWDKKEIQKDYEPIQIDNEKAETNQERIYVNTLRWLSKHDEYKDGNKHNFLMRLVFACNRFGLDKEFVISKLIFEFQNKASYVKDGDFIFLVNNIYKNYSHEHSIAFYDKKQNAFDEDGKELTDKVFDSEICRDVIYIENLEKELDDAYDNGLELGETTYFDNIDPLFKWKRGFLNVVTGIPGHGKSTFMKQLALIKSVKENCKWGVFSPEEFPPVVFFDDLIHSLVGKNTSKNYKDRMDKQTFVSAREFLRNRFFYVFPENDEPTPELVINRMEELIRKHGINGVIIDPFNQLEHNWGNGRDDLYVSSFLSKLKRFALLHKIYMVVIAHPRTLNDKDINGNYKCPNVFDLAHGAMWNNKADTITVVHREQRENTEILFKSLKIKQQKLVGIPGETRLMFEPKSQRYLVNGLNPLMCNENPFLRIGLQEDIF